MHPRAGHHNAPSLTRPCPIYSPKTEKPATTGPPGRSYPLLHFSPSNRCYKTTSSSAKSARTPSSHVAAPTSHSPGHYLHTQINRWEHTLSSLSSDHQIRTHSEKPKELRGHLVFWHAFDCTHRPKSTPRREVRPTHAVEAQSNHHHSSLSRLLWNLSGCSDMPFLSPDR